MNHHEMSQVAGSLHSAIVAGDCDGAKAILQRLQPEDSRRIVRGVNHKGQSALDVALNTDYPIARIDFGAAMERFSQAMARGDTEAIENAIPTDTKATMVKLLVQGGAKTTTKLLIHETLNGGYSSLSAVLERSTPSVINGVNEEGWTALQLAVFHNKGYTILSSLLGAGANPNAAGPAGDLPLHIAVIKRLGYTTMSKLLSNGANPNAQNNSGQSALHLAVLHDLSYYTLSSLIKKGANVNIQDANGKTPLHLLLKMTDKDNRFYIDTLLQARRCNPNIQDHHGRTALHYHAKDGEYRPDQNAGINGHLDAQLQQMMQDHQRQNEAMLRQMEVQRRQMRARRRQMLARFMAQMGQLPPGYNPGNDEEEDLDNHEEGDGTIVSALICAGSDVHLMDHKGRTPLFYAAEAGHLEILVALLQAGANPNVQNETTPLHLAVTHGHTAIVEALLQAGSSVHALEAASGSTCLHCAASRDDTSILALLLRAGANPNAKNHNLEET